MIFRQNNLTAAVRNYFMLIVEYASEITFNVIIIVFKTKRTTGHK